MALFAIADLHLSFGTDKPMDVFSGWHDYVSRIEANWKNIVRESDTVVIPGDVSWAMNFSELYPDFAFLHALPGRKILLKGNHDYWWTTLAKMNRFIGESGFDTIRILHNSAVEAEGICVCGTRGWLYDSEPDDDRKILLREAGRLRLSLEAAAKTGLEPVVFLHYPPVYGDFVCGEILQVLQEYGVRRCCYGHLHGRAALRAVEGVSQGILFRLVSCDHLKFLPMRIE